MTKEEKLIQQLKMYMEWYIERYGEYCTMVAQIKGLIIMLEIEKKYK